MCSILASGGSQRTTLSGDGPAYIAAAATGISHPVGVKGREYDVSDCTAGRRPLPARSPIVRLPPRVALAWKQHSSDQRSVVLFCRTAIAFTFRLRVSWEARVTTLPGYLFITLPDTGFTCRSNIVQFCVRAEHARRAQHASNGEPWVTGVECFASVSSAFSSQC